MSEAFTVGDVVKLKSGGSAMTVEEIDGSYISCVWSEAKKIERATFPAATLIGHTPGAMPTMVI